MGLSNNLGKLSNIITSTGSAVGIAQTSPSYTLDVSGTVRGTTSAYFATTSGSVGIGTTTLTSGIPLSINVATGNNCNIAFQENSSDKWYLRNITSSNAFSFYSVSGSTEVMRLTSAGNVGIGTPSPAGKLDVYAGSYQNLIFKAESANQSSLRFNESTNGPRLYSDAGTEEFRMQQSYTGTGFLTFYTGPTERMRITSGGDVFVGFSGSAPGQRLRVQGADSGSANYSLVVANSTTASTFIVRNDGAIFLTGPYPFTTASGSNMWLDTSGVIQRNVSSIKYKTDVQDYDKGLTELMKLRPVSYLSKSEIDSPKRYAGMIAEELHELGFTEYVNLDENGEPDSISYASMVTILTKAIQEMNTKLDAQNQTIQSLQERITKAGL